MRSCPLALLLACCLAARGADEPAPAVLIDHEGKTTDVFVISETVDGVKFQFPDAFNKPGGAESAKARKDIKEVRYKEVVDQNWIRGEAHARADKPQPEKAASFYLMAASESKYAWLRELAYLNAARNFMLAKKHAEALDTLARFEAACPKSVHLPQAYDLRIQAALDKGDKKAVEDALVALGKRLGELGARGIAAIAKAEAALRRMDKKPAEAAAKLKEGLGKLQVESAPEAYGELMQLLAEDQRAARQETEALATLRRLVFLPVGSDAQAAAHLEVARILGERSDLKDLAQAFDHAVLACMLGSDGNVRRSAMGQARSVVTKLEKDARYDSDAAFTDEVKEYRANLNNFR